MNKLNEQRRFTLRWPKWFVLSAFLPIVVSYQPACAEEGPSLGIVASKPQHGHAVECEQGFMVAYKQRIPGTEVVFEMVPVPGSRYEGIQPFWIGKFEVTLRQYRHYAALYGVFKSQRSQTESRDVDSVDAVSAPTPVYNPRDRFAVAASLDCPAYSMTLYSAKQYTKWLSLVTSQPYRLPLESEWMEACRAGGSGYIWKDEQLRKLAFFDYETEGVQPIGLKKPNALGIHDMHGNVSEWVITSFPCKQRASESVSDIVNPGVQPPIWIAKGGSFASRLDECLPERRFVVTEEEWDGEANFPKSVTWLGSYSDRTKIGFRVVRELGELDKSEMSKFWDVADASYAELIEMKLDSGRGAKGNVTEDLVPRLNKEYQKLEKWIH